MRSILITATAMLSLAATAGAEVRTHSGFTSVSAADRIPVEVTIGERYRVEVTGADADRVHTQTDGEALRIRQRNRPWFGGTPRINARVHVTLPSLESLAASRGASIRAEDVEAEGMDLSASMGGEVTITGACRAVSATASMGGSVEAQGMRCQRASVSASMGGAAEVYASASFDASASMGGTVRVLGNPTERDVSTSMGGSVSTH